MIPRRDCVRSHGAIVPSASSLSRQVRTVRSDKSCRMCANRKSYRGHAARCRSGGVRRRTSALQGAGLRLRVGHDKTHLPREPSPSAIPVQAHMSRPLIHQSLRRQLSTLIASPDVRAGSRTRLTAPEGLLMPNACSHRCWPQRPRRSGEFTHRSVADQGRHRRERSGAVRPAMVGQAHQVLAGARRLPTAIGRDRRLIQCPRDRFDARRYHGHVV